MTFKILLRAIKNKPNNNFVLFNNKEHAKKFSAYLMKKHHIMDMNEAKTAYLPKHIYQKKQLNGEFSYLLVLSPESINVLEDAKTDLLQSIKHALNRESYPFWSTRELEHTKKKNGKEISELAQVSALTGHIGNLELS